MCIFTDTSRLRALQNGLLAYAAKYQWRLEAWAVFPNHYHFIGHSPANVEGAESLRIFLNHFHGRSSAWVNRKDGITGRKVWHNYWDSQLTFRSSYLTRLSYVHRNAVHHGLVSVPDQYRWCSASWFQRNSSPAMVRTLYAMKTDRVHVADDF